MKQAAILILILIIGIICVYKIFGQKGDTMSNTYQATFGSPLTRAELVAADDYIPQFEFQQESDESKGIKVGPGNWNDLPYLANSGVKVYRVLLSQSGTSDPDVQSTLENTVGELVWTRNDVGEYIGTPTEALDPLRVFVENSSPIGGGNPATVWIEHGDGSIQVATTADSLLNKTPIGFVVYPAS